MSEDDEKKLDGLNSVWRTCNKIRDAIQKIDINLWETFKKYDPNQNNLISESKFVNIFGQQLRGTLGLSEQEVTELTDYFRVQDGRIAYVQFCSVIHGSALENKPNESLVTGLEWEDPLHTNRLSVTENRQYCVLMMKIAHSVRLRELVLRPYFQDYELIAQNVGTVTLAHFARVLKFLGLMLSAYDYQLLVKRFIKDSFTVNYVAFVEEIERIVQYLDQFRLIDYSDDVIENFPGKLIDAELPKLPRPEVGTVNIGEVYGKQSSNHPVLKKNRPTMAMKNLVQRIMKFVHDNQLRVQDYFQMFDPLRSGYITRSQFIRGLDSMGLSSLRRLYLSDLELQNLTDLYSDENDTKRVDWKTFERNIEQVFTESGLDKKPYIIVESPPQQIGSLSPMGQANWHDQPLTIRDRCEDAVFKVKSRIQKRGLYLEPFFRDLDKINIAHVTKNQERALLLSNGILLSEEELYALESRYNDDMGFHYMKFLADTDPKDLGPSKVNEFIERSELVNRIAKKPLPALSAAKDLVQVVAKVKGIVSRNQIRVLEFMEGFDTHRELCILEPDFRRGLDAANVRLAVSEVDQLCMAFKSALRNGYVDYKRFCQMVDEVGYQIGMERAPLIVPLQHITSSDGPTNFLNFEERTITSKALETLAKYPDQVSNLRSLFQDYDRVNCGTLNTNQFLRALTTRGLHTAISTREYELLCKCFGRERGGRIEVDYRTFLRNLAILNETIVRYPF